MIKRFRDGCFKCRGFSLIELSVVLAVGGLLVGGVLGGQALINASGRMSVASEYKRYNDAVTIFYEKYRAIPGDMSDAEDRWGASTSNGDGDGVIDAAAMAGARGEAFELWNQLALDGRISGKYSGTAGSAAGMDTVFKANAPASRMGNAGWGVMNRSNYAGDSNSYAFNYGNAFVFGAASPGNPPLGAALKPQDAWTLDTKIDDGKPASGTMIAIEGGGFSGASASKCTTSTSNSDYAGGYNMGGSNIACGLYLVSKSLNSSGGGISVVDGGWGSWSACSVSCGGGTQTRSCDSPAPSVGGAGCSGASSQTCNTAACAGPVIDGGWGGWSAWSSCSVSCGGGTQTRSRSCDSPAPSGGGAACSGSATDSQACNTAACAGPVIDGGWGGWSAWSSCSVSCGGGTQTRSRSCDSPAPSGGGAACSGSATDSQSCNNGACPPPSCYCMSAQCEGVNLVSRDSCTNDWSGCSVDWNSASCGYTPPPPSCTASSSCSGTTLNTTYSDCSTGSEANSVSCGYTPPPSCTPSSSCSGTTLNSIYSDCSTGSQANHPSCAPAKTWQYAGGYASSADIAMAYMDMNCGGLDPVPCAGCSNFPWVSGCTPGADCGSETLPCMINGTVCSMASFGGTAYIWDRYECLP